MAYYNVFTMFVMILVLSSMQPNLAAEYIVGDQSGWNRGVNYKAWTSGKYFAVGDKLVFNYKKGVHNVVEVEYESGQTISSDASGHTIITLARRTVYQFVSTVAGDKEHGMSFIADAQGSRS